MKWFLKTMMVWSQAIQDSQREALACWTGLCKEADPNSVQLLTIAERGLLYTWTQLAVDGEEAVKAASHNSALQKSNLEHRRLGWAGLSLRYLLWWFPAPAGLRLGPCRGKGPLCSQSSQHPQCTLSRTGTLAPSGKGFEGAQRS